VKGSDREMKIETERSFFPKQLPQPLPLLPLLVGRGHDGPSGTSKVPPPLPLSLALLAPPAPLPPHPRVPCQSGGTGPKGDEGRKKSRRDERKGEGDRRRKSQTGEGDETSHRKGEEGAEVLVLLLTPTHVIHERPPLSHSRGA